MADSRTSSVGPISASSAPSPSSGAGLPGMRSATGADPRQRVLARLAQRRAPRLRAALEHAAREWRADAGQDARDRAPLLVRSAREPVALVELGLELRDHLVP